jgi:hypothetical protein
MINIHLLQLLISYEPIGAPNATETPAAAAAESISRFFASFWPYLGNSRANILPQHALQ